jgi:hypothetical protein
VRRVLRFASAGAMLIAIAGLIHAGAWISFKDIGKGARGHSSLRAATDTEIELVQHCSRIFLANADTGSKRVVAEAPSFEVFEMHQ